MSKPNVLLMRKLNRHCNQMLAGVMSGMTEENKADPAKAKAAACLVIAQVFLKRANDAYCTKRLMQIIDVIENGGVLLKEVEREEIKNSRIILPTGVKRKV